MLIFVYKYSTEYIICVSVFLPLLTNQHLPASLKIFVETLLTTIFDLSRKIRKIKTQNENPVPPRMSKTLNKLVVYRSTFFF